jgi:uncharacterized Zn finger protein
VRDWPDWRNFPKSETRVAKGGIRAQSQHGSFGQKWWAQRWISVLEGFQLGGRLQRARSYARRGQVLGIEVADAAVTATVLGSRPTPYTVRMAVKPLSKREWRKLAGAVAGQALFGAKLLGGEMPRDIESVFEGAGLSLFPKSHSDLMTECSCPDWSNPCKHIAAVYYLLGEEFDRDPFLIFQLRGMGREQFLELLGETQLAAAPAPVTQAELPPEPLPVSPQSFWSGGALPEDLIGGPHGDGTGAALPRRLGKFPFWRGHEDFLGVLESIYRAAASKTAEMLGEQ